MEEVVERTDFVVSKIDLCPEDIVMQGYQQIPITEISSLGLVGKEFSNILNNITCQGGEGLYKVSFPNGVEGSLSRFKNEDAFLGSIRGDGGFAQARLNQVFFSPERLLFAIVLLGINNKLNSIMETQNKILDFMYIVQEANLKGNIKSLNEAMHDYKYNHENQEYIYQQLNLVNEIKKEANATIYLCSNSIKNIMP